MLTLAASRLASARARAAALAARRAGLAAAAPAARPARMQEQQQRHAASASAGSAGPTTSAAAQQDDEDPALQLVQYLVLRRDLWRLGSSGTGGGGNDNGAAGSASNPTGWPLGPLVAQGAHAATAALTQALSAGSEHARAYCSPENVANMRKVVLEVEDERRLRAMAERLAAAGVGHWLWVEQPEGYATALATWPAPRGEVAPHVKKGKLCKAGVGAGGGGGGGEGG
jgi:peptidyl-tRNA hydrolase